MSMQQASPPRSDQLVPEKKSKVKTALKCFLIVFAILMVVDLLGALGDADTKTSTPPVDVPSAVDDTTSGSSNGITADDGGRDAGLQDRRVLRLLRHGR